jgi:hypothetical protein
MDDRVIEELVPSRSGATQKTLLDLYLRQTAVYGGRDTQRARTRHKRVIFSVLDVLTC